MTISCIVSKIIQEAMKDSKDQRKDEVKIREVMGELNARIDTLLGDTETDGE